MKQIILIALLFVVPVLAQDIPQPRALTSTDYFLEIAQLHMQVKQMTEYIQTLQALIKTLQDENAKLKHAQDSQ